MVLNVFLLLSISWWLLEGFGNQHQVRRYRFSLGLSVLNGQFHCNIQTLPITPCLGNIITKLSWDRPRGPVFRARAEVAVTSPPVHLRYMALMSLRLNSGGMAEAACVG